MQPSTQIKTGKYVNDKTGLSRIFYTLINSRDGFIAAVRNEAAFRQLLVLHSILTILAFILVVNPTELVILLMISFISLIVELLNSAIEATVDRISLELHPLSKSAKDMGSAAQTIALLMVITAWVIIMLLE